MVYGSRLSDSVNAVNAKMSSTIKSKTEKQKKKKKKFSSQEELQNTIELQPTNQS